METNDRLLGKLEEHAKYTAERLDNIEFKLDVIQSFRWKLLGIASMISFLVTIAMELMVTGFMHK